MIRDVVWANVQVVGPTVEVVVAERRWHPIKEGSNIEKTASATWGERVRPENIKPEKGYWEEKARSFKKQRSSKLWEVRRSLSQDVGGNQVCSPVHLKVGIAKRKRGRDPEGQIGSICTSSGFVIQTEPVQ